ncbi:MAG: hypothetical protein LBD77_03235 [Bifidobacteriaceae bacterium]|nr:hypothetical protein [Bifidobacteriaceae bacterium]
MTAYAAATASTASYSVILDSAAPGQDAKPSRNTVSAYAALLDRVWVEVTALIEAARPGADSCNRLVNVGGTTSPWCQQQIWPISTPPRTAR